jgi:hypothetical protein
MAAGFASAPLIGRSRTIAIAASLAALLGSAVVSSSPAAASTDADLQATLSLPQGEIDFALETDVLQSFDEEGVPFLISVFDGCAINDHYWVWAAGLGSEAVPLQIFDERSGNGHRTVLPAYVPGEPIDTVFEPEALAICRDSAGGGLPEIEGTATYTTVTPRCADGTEGIVLLSEGRADAYRSVVRGDSESDLILGTDPIAIRDQSPDWDELFLLIEGRTPGLVEGVRFSGEAGMLPRGSQLERSLRDLTRARIRRAFEAAKNKLTPDQLIDELGLDDVGCVFHVGLDFDTPGAPSYLAEAGWIRGGGAAIVPPRLVEPRFEVALVQADGGSVALPLTAPWQDSPGEGTFWEYASDTAKVRILDGCSLGTAFWIVAAAVTDEPLELVITDTKTGNSATQLLWTDREAVSRLTDTSALACL